ncbi:hypothetical protein HMI55_003966 [Coelomomyces lativittatus]|nr:hypothetical protein HMI56_006131 [Coelomomyces lativittatus]KAJ1500277.1 hypothetical protein HMI55_003966 [Coelomomyces lativittatus]
MMGSYAPKPEIEEIKFPPNEAPSGMLARGTYDVHSKFIDDDGTTHLEFQWKFEIKKDWN